VQVVGSEIRWHKAFGVDLARIHHTQAQLRGVQARTYTAQVWRHIAVKTLVWHGSLVTQHTQSLVAIGHNGTSALDVARLLGQRLTETLCGWAHCSRMGPSEKPTAQHQQQGQP
jgi:hypothetical protein